MAHMMNCCTEGIHQAQKWADSKQTVASFDGGITAHAFLSPKVNLRFETDLCTLPCPGKVPRYHATHARIVDTDFVEDRPSPDDDATAPLTKITNDEFSAALNLPATGRMQSSRVALCPVPHDPHHPTAHFAFRDVTGDFK